MYLINETDQTALDQTTAQFVDRVSHFFDKSINAITNAFNKCIENLKHADRTASLEPSNQHTNQSDTT